jgi:hypothetical protein
MKPHMNRLQTLLSMVKNITTRPPTDDPSSLEPWELATAKMEQMELSFDSGPSYRRADSTSEGAVA